MWSTNIHLTSPLCKRGKQNIKKACTVDGILAFLLTSHCTMFYLHGAYSYTELQ